MDERDSLREQVAFQIKRGADGGMRSRAWSRRENQWCLDVADVIIVQVAEALLREITDTVAALRAAAPAKEETKS